MNNKELMHKLEYGGILYFIEEVSPADIDDEYFSASLQVVQDYYEVLQINVERIRKEVHG